MKQLRYGERGQVLVMAALMMTALLGMLGLVIDVGNAYAQRRFMQNGADAAAVAAARYMATNRSTANDPGVMGTMTPLLTSNGSGALASPTTQSDGAWYVRLDGSVAGPAG